LNHEKSASGMKKKKKKEKSHVIPSREGKVEGFSILPKGEKVNHPTKRRKKGEIPPSSIPHRKRKKKKIAVFPSGLRDFVIRGKEKKGLGGKPSFQPSVKRRKKGGETIHFICRGTFPPSNEKRE